ncbi:acyltransferase domain-containing protein [Streptomyces sp. NPDC057302]|uniref:acyltransferase domain-containing protein n=1 Tax=Streptomyces sp. NPDC057302 TaxID=3346094 RepID=UPI00363DACD7
MSAVVPGGPQEEVFAAWLREHAGRYVHGEVSLDTPLLKRGLDSVAMLSLFGEIEEAFGLVLDPADLWDQPTVRELAWYLAALSAARPGASSPIRTAFVFTGQGSQHLGMTVGLYRNSTSFRRHLREAAAAVLPHFGVSVTELVLSEDPRIHETAVTQPALLAVEYALAMTLLEEDVRPEAVLGHGIGEFAAAAVAGALTLADAAELVSHRGAIMQELPPGGGMMATCADPFEAAEVTAGEPRVSIAALNAARATILSGDLAGLDRAQERLDASGISSTFLKVTHAFHSPLMEPSAPPFQTVAQRLSGGKPQLPFYSTVYGRRHDGPLDAAYWTTQITSPVRFADATRLLLAEHAPTHVVEIGPKAVLSPFLRRIGGAKGPKVLPVCRGPRSDAVHLAGVLSALSAGPLVEQEPV